MKVYLINLDKDVERLAAADAQLRRLGVDYERVPAVYAKELATEEKRRAVKRFRWWCATGLTVRDGEIGCALSHYGIYRRIVKQNEPACVLEDDVILNKEFKPVLEFVAGHLDLSRPMVALLSNHTRKAIQSESSPALVPAITDQYAEGYVMTPKAAAALLKANWPLQVPCDHWGRWAKQGVIELFHAIPTVCSQDQRQYASGTVGPGVGWASDMPFGRRMVYKFKRLLGLSYDKLLLFVERRRTANRLRSKS